MRPARKEDVSEKRKEGAEQPSLRSRASSRGEKKRRTVVLSGKRPSGKLQGLYISKYPGTVRDHVQDAMASRLPFSSINTDSVTIRLHAPACIVGDRAMECTASKEVSTRF